MVPHLTTALTGPLLTLEKKVLGAMPEIEHWFRQKWMEHAAPFYASVDLRNSGFKLAPVDTNLFPAGFNNLREEFHPLAVQALMSAVEKPRNRTLVVDTRKSHPESVLPTKFGYIAKPDCAHWSAGKNWLLAS